MLESHLYMLVTFSGNHLILINNKQIIFFKICFYLHKSGELVTCYLLVSVFRIMRSK